MCPTAMDNNNNGGGWYVVGDVFFFRLTVGRAMGNFSVHRYTLETFIKIWYWPRSAGNIPSAGVWKGFSSINADAWDTPSRTSPNTQCDISSKFGPSNTIIYPTFCEFRLFVGATRTRPFVSSKRLIYVRCLLRINVYVQARRTVV
jgi:hypothetical protein